ncbi:hypothetical protein IP87_15230 [beta proteobacterium AAP121]|nr:hypothetical protein IP80_05490 [beta proteobacterium AAP65]KPF95897.1 hypothetical protein IP87_15230 [beta proteobacterium AAP121]
MHFVSSIRAALAAMLVAGLSASAPASAQEAGFYGWKLAGGWPVAQMAANADWSSDLGPDYRFGATSSPDGSSVSWSGPGRHWASRSGYSNTEADITVGWELDARGGAVGQTYSGGELFISPQQTLNPGVVISQTFHLWSVLGDNEPGYGISTDARHVGYPALYLGTQPMNVYWRLDWASSASGNALTGSSLYFAGLFNQAIGGTSGSFTGLHVHNGSAQSAWPTFDVILTTSAGDSAGDPRAGRIDTWLTVSFSSQPILSPVPEPATWALMLGGVAALLVRRRQTR